MARIEKGGFPAPSASPSVFLSHDRRDGALALNLKATIETRLGDKCRVFVSSAPGDIRIGKDWLGQIRKRLREAHLVLVLCSPRAMKKFWVGFETGSGWIKGTPLLPVCVGRMKESRLPMPLAMFQALDFAGGPDSVRRLVFQIAQMLNLEVPSESRTALIAEIELRLETATTADLIYIRFELQDFLRQFPGDGKAMRLLDRVGIEIISSSSFAK